MSLTGDRDLVSPLPRQDRPGESVRDVLPLLAQVHARLLHGLSGVPDGPTAEWGPDHADSPAPQAAVLRERGVGFEWTLIAFPGRPLWDLHVGVVPRSEDALALGLHWHQSLHESIPTVARKPAARAISRSFHPTSNEHHADLLVLAWRTFDPERVAQVLSDTALELALSLHEPLAQELSQPNPTVAKEPLK